MIRSYGFSGSVRERLINLNLILTSEGFLATLRASIQVIPPVTDPSFPPWMEAAHIE